MAVAGAVWVGLRQARISAKQTEILGNQVHLDELTLRHELFDRRWKVYQTTESFLAFILREADYPEEQMFDLARAVAHARFLFRSAVRDELDAIFKKSLSFRTLKKRMQTTFDAEGHYGEGNPEREHDELAWFHERLKTLPDLFGDEMKLS